MVLLVQENRNTDRGDHVHAYTASISGDMVRVPFTCRRRFPMLYIVLVFPQAHVVKVVTHGMSASHERSLSVHVCVIVVHPSANHAKLVS